MFNEIKITNFKSISDIHLANLSRFNIFFGKNNSGKSTLLEAVFMLTAPASPDVLLTCNRFRGYNKISDFSYFFNRLDTNKNIILKGCGDKNFNREIKIHIKENPIRIINSEEPADDNPSNINKEQQLFIESEVDGNSLESSFLIKVKNDMSEEGVLKTVPYKENIFSCFMSPSYSFTSLLETIKNIFKERRESVLISLMQNFDSHIKDIVLVGNEIMVDAGLESRIPLNFLGDGIRKIFSIAANIVSCRNGILLIDEIDNGVHFSVMGNLWEQILRMAEQNNTQIFATTHNIDSLKGLKRCIDMNTVSNLSFYKLVHRDDDKNVVINYTPENFSQMLEMENEIR